MRGGNKCLARGLRQFVLRVTNFYCARKARLSPAKRIAISSSIERSGLYNVTVAVPIKLLLKISQSNLIDCKERRMVGSGAKLVKGAVFNTKLLQVIVCPLAKTPLRCMHANALLSGSFFSCRPYHRQANVSGLTLFFGDEL